MNPLLLQSLFDIFTLSWYLRLWPSYTRVNKLPDYMFLSITQFSRLILPCVTDVQKLTSLPRCVQTFLKFANPLQILLLKGLGNMNKICNSKYLTQIFSEKNKKLFCQVFRISKTTIPLSNRIWSGFANFKKVWTQRGKEVNCCTSCHAR